MDAFEGRLTALLPRLRRFGRALTGHAADADDLVQTALERALDRRRQWQAGTSLEAWMFRIMKNAWIDEARARARRGRISAPEGKVGAQALRDCRIGRRGRIHRGAAGGIQFAVGVAGQDVVAHGHPGPPANVASWACSAARPRPRRLVTVPTGVSRTSAASS